MPQIDKFVAWASGPDVYTLDIDRLRWTKHPPAATNHVSPGNAQQWGTFGRFRYIPSRNLFIVCNNVKKNVFLYRLNGDKPNPIVAVEAKAVRKSIERSIPAAAISVEAVYADGSRRDVTREANYLSLDPAIAEIESRGGGLVTGRAIGAAHFRADVHRSGLQTRLFERSRDRDRAGRAAPTLDALHVSANRLTIVPGETFQLHAIGA